MYWKKKRLTIFVVSGILTLTLAILAFRFGYMQAKEDRQQENQTEQNSQL